MSTSRRTGLQTSTREDGEAASFCCRLESRHTSTVFICSPIATYGPGVLERFGLGRALSEPEWRAGSVGGAAHLLHWAGTETSSEGTGFMDGAIRAGDRAGKAAAETVRLLACGEGGLAGGAPAGGSRGDVGPAATGTTGSLGVTLTGPATAAAQHHEPLLIV